MKAGAGMAKDGTARGGARYGAGRKPKPLADSVMAGESAKAIELPEVYEETWRWLKDRGCERLVNTQRIEQYAMSVSRWIQCEECISEFGFLAKHPTTGNAIASPYVSMSQQYMKQVNQIWYQIFQVVKENCSQPFSGNTPQDDVMERLLMTRKGM